MKSVWKSSTCFRAAFLTQILALILNVIGFVTDSWVQSDEFGFGIHKQGLWRRCSVFQVAGIEETNCLSGPLYENEGWFMAVKTFAILGLVCLILVVIMSALLMFVMTNSRMSRVDCHVTSIAGIFIIIANAVFAYKQNVLKLGYSCWLSWLSCVVLVVAAILLECDNRKSSAQEHVTVVGEEQNADNPI